MDRKSEPNRLAIEINMESWEITRTTYKVSDFLSWQRTATLILSPSFQRRPVWNPGAKSYLIDTILKGYPIPIIFLRELPADIKTLESKREVVDGQQRIRTLISFISPTLLDDFDPERDEFSLKRNHIKEFAGKQYRDLPNNLKQRILEYQFSVHVFPSDTDDRSVLQIFARMNATGVKLNAQELRNATYFGVLKTLMYELAAEQLERWRNWKIFTEGNIARMDEVELTSEFAQLMTKGITNRSQVRIDRLYEAYDENLSTSNELAKRFRTVMDSIDKFLGSELEFLPFKNKTLFYSLFAAFYHAHFGIDQNVSKRIKAKAIKADFVEWLKKAGDRIEKHKAPERVLDAAARRTTHRNSRMDIFNYLTKLA